MEPTNITVLFVDDDKSLTDMAAQALPNHGFKVDIANSAEEALEIIRGGMVPDVLCTDIVMPGGTGVNLAKDVSISYPGAKILLITGDNDQVLPQNTRSGFEVLGKPYLFSTLARKLREMVGDPRP